jgi:hypothetical protein
MLARPRPMEAMERRSTERDGELAGGHFVGEDTSVWDWKEQAWSTTSPKSYGRCGRS